MVWIIQTEHWPRAYLRAELIERGFQAIGFQRMQEAFAALRHGIYENPFLLVIDLRDSALEEREITALSHLSIPKILLGSALVLNETWIDRIIGALLIKRPFTIGELADLVETLWRGPR